MAVLGNLTPYLFGPPGFVTSLLDGSTKPVGTPPPPPASTLFGAWVKPHSGETVPQGFTRFETNIGAGVGAGAPIACQVQRLYDDGSGPAALLTVMNANRKGVVPICGSFTYGSTAANAPAALAAVAAGSHDTDINGLLAGCPTNMPTWLTINHEFDHKVNIGTYAFSDWLPAWKQFVKLVNANGNANIIPIPILTGSSWPARFNSYFPDTKTHPGIGTSCTTVGLDPYSNNQTAQDRIAAMYNLLVKNHYKMAICETGTNDRPSGGTVVQDYVSSLSWLDGKAEFVTIFNSPIGTNYEIDDLATPASDYGTIVND